uniref:SOWAHA-C winged helix-turn-helix domain-containing protein n=1 Tax=Mastacembelus armatus TaxID=205130 RepID=A0A3Q3LUW5_9TELE
RGDYPSESILSFLLEHGGKVKNSELLNNFRSHINCSDPAEKQHNRDLFKKLVNSVAVVKQIDEVKFVVVKKRYQDFVKEEAHDASQKTQMEDTFPSPNTSFSSTSDRAEDVLLSGTQCRKTRQTEDVQLPGLTQLRPQNKTTRHADDAKCSECVPLEPLAHEWLVECAAGRWGQVYALLLQDTRLAQKRDFMSGFTALHWAAKDGNSQMMHKLIEISRKRGTYMNINSKAHGGYTPLHIAAIHGHTEVMVLLVQGYGANINERDNDGKKALHYVGNEVSAEIRALLGGLQQIKYRGKSLSSNNEAISKPVPEQYPLYCHVEKTLLA